MRRQLAAHFAINGYDAVVSEAIVNSFFVASSDQMQIGQSVAESVQVRGIKRLNWQFRSLDVPSDGEAFSLKIQMKSATFRFKRLNTGKILSAQMKQKVDFLFCLNFAFDFVDFEKKFSALCFDQVVRVYRSGSHPGKIHQIAKSELLYDFPDV